MTDNKDTIVLIPALKKNVAFQDDLVKKLAGITLVQRAINNARQFGVDDHDILLVTDSEEISLISQRCGIPFYLDPKIRWDESLINGKLFHFLNSRVQSKKYVLFLSPYAPLLKTDMVHKAKKDFIDCDKDILKPIKLESRQLFDDNGKTLLQAVFGTPDELHKVESKAFIWIRADLVKDGFNKKPKILPWEVSHDLLEICSFQDWWVCEKLLQRKRIIFRVIGNAQVGMGHIYRALSLAHEVTDHEVLFVSDSESSAAVNKLAGYDYWLGIYNKKDIVEKIVELKPDLVINDILATEKSDVLPLKERDIRVINFEDVGNGARHTDVTINELFDVPQFDGENIFWGHDYFFVRDEFCDAKPHAFEDRVESILLVFGGTDQHDLSRNIYFSIRDICMERDIHINIVTGPGYKGYSQLSLETKNDKNTSLTHATGVISGIMEKSQLAITSNGRTVYELAHMNIPAIVIPQHAREGTHTFASEDNGFVPLAIYHKDKTVIEVKEALERLLDDTEHRHMLYSRQTKYSFSDNKKHILDLMYKQLS